MVPVLIRSLNDPDSQFRASLLRIVTELCSSLPSEA